MSTVDKDIADRIIAGEWPKDKARRIVKYINAWGGESYGVTFKRDDPLKYLRPTEYIRNPVIYWEYKPWKPKHPWATMGAHLTNLKYVFTQGMDTS